MSLNGYSLKLKETGNPSGGPLPQYSLSYQARNESSRAVSYAVLTALAGDSDLVVEIHTDLFKNHAKSIQELLLPFMDRIKSLGIRYKHQNMTSTRKDTLLGFVLKSTVQTQAQVVTAYIPNAIWKQKLFAADLPNCGVTYHMTRASDERDSETIDKLLTVSPDERASVFNMSLFDIICYGHMGITTYSVTKDELSGLLGL